LNNKSRKNNNEEFNIRETYEKSLSLLSLKDTHREEAKVRERVWHLEKLEEFRSEHEDALKKKDKEIQKLKLDLKDNEKYLSDHFNNRESNTISQDAFSKLRDTSNRIIDEHNLEIENIKLKYRQNEYELLKKIEDLKSKNHNLKKAYENLSMQVQHQNTGNSQIREKSLSETRKQSKSKSKTSKSKPKKVKKNWEL